MADLNNIDAEIKRIEQLKQKYTSLLDVERSLNTSMLYSTGVRKKYTDALSAAATAQKDLMTRESKQTNIIIRNNSGIKTSLKYYKDLKKKHDDLRVVQKKLKKGSAKDREEWKKNQKVMKNLGDEMKSVKGSISNMEDEMDKAVKDTKALKGSAEALKGTFDDLKIIDSRDISSALDLNDLTQQRLDIMRQQFEIQKNSGTLSDDEADSLKEKLGNLEEMNKVRNDLLKGDLSDNLAPMVDDLTKSASELADPKKFKKNAIKELDRASYAAQSRKGVGLRASQGESLKTVFSGRSSFGSKMGALKSFKSAGKDLNKLDAIMGKTGKTALSAGGMMKMLGSALNSLGKLGWIGLIIQAVAAVANAVNELDKFIKNFNQTFAKLQGPTVMMKDVRKSMKEFTGAIFDLKRNLKYGLKSEEIMGMFQAVSESGMSLQGILQSVSGGYDKLIEDAAKVSFDFGVSMEEAGAMLGEQMTDLKSSVDEASESFKVMSYDASIAGIQSQKFYQATYAAAEALSYYGKFLDSASNNLKNFQKQGGMGFKDAQKQTQTMTNLFKDMDKNTRVAFINMSGGVESYRKDFIKLEEESKQAITKHLDSIATKRKELEEAKKKGDEDTISRLQNEIKAEETQLTTAQKTMAMAGTAAKANAQDMAMYLEMISDKAGEKMGQYFKMLRENNGPDVFTTSTRAMVEHMKALLGVSDDFAMQMIGTVKTTRVGIEQMARDLQGVVDELPGTEKSVFGDKVMNIIRSGMEGDKMNMEKIREGLSKYTELSGKGLDTIMGNLEKLPSSVQAFMEKGYQGVMSDIENITLEEGKHIEKITGEGDKEQEKRLDDLVKNTHTIGDFVDINKDQLKYIAASSKPQELLADAAIATARSTSKILDFIVGRFGKTKEQKFNENLQKGLLKDVTGYKYEQLKMKEEYDKTTDKGKRSYLSEKIKDYDEIISNTYADNDTIMDATIAAEKKLAEELEKKRLQEENNKKQKATRTEKGKPSIVPGTVIPVKPEGDYKASKGGYALLSKGDVVVNARNMSKGMGGDLGAFAGTAASDMIRNMGNAGSPKQMSPQIPVSITIGSVSGNPEEFLKSIKPAIEQAFERMYFDKQKRV